ncbi:MAG TPA: asparagine synthase (glutamine-hydrolyzing), partial [Rhodothermales bacterium]
MCGILGVLQRGDRVSLSAIEAGRDAMVHRGPDGAGLWHDVTEEGTRVALGHRRLSIIDLSDRGLQPLITTSEGCTRPAAYREQGGATFALTYNGEIYNYIELREELERLGHPFSSSCDTEVLLRAYQQWGDECVRRFNGMFAFAIWDARRQALFCARDRFGEKPFHYVLDEGTGVFAFASEIKALVRAGITGVEFDDRAVFRYLRFREQAGAEQTIWKGVRRLPAAHAMVVSFRRHELHADVSRYWDVGTATTTSLSKTEQVTRFRELFRDSVALRLRADVPVGTGLSGGVDSSSVVCQIHQLEPDADQQSFTARMDDPSLDESHHARVVAEHARVVAHDVTPTPTSFLDELDSLFDAQEEPFPSTSMFASYLVNRLARDEGVVVLLDGQGADEYLAGYAHYPALILSSLARSGRFIEWYRERAAISRNLSIDPVPPRAALFHFARRGKLNALDVDSTLPTPFLSPDFSRQFSDESPRRIDITSTPLKTRLYADLMLGHLQELLRYGDRNSMHFSREVRLPFLDYRLVEFALSLPDESLFFRGESKWVLRRAMRGIVPDSILDRRDKVGFATPWRTWWDAEQGSALRELLDAAGREL